MASNAQKASEILNRGKENKSQDGKFLPAVKVNGRSKKLKTYVTSITLVKELKQIIENEEGGSAANMTLLYKAKKLEDQRTLAFYEILTSFCEITRVKQVIGGAKADDDRKLDINNPLIKISKKPDSITYDDNDKENRALMSCGHTFSASTMFIYIRSSFEKDDRLSEFRCPVKNCGKAWDWSVVASVADLTEDEFSRYNDILQKNELLLAGYGSCPHCGNAIEKPQDLSQNRVRCDCNGGDFCWMCSKKWKSGGFQICGNTECDTTKTADFIANCPLKEADSNYLTKKDVKVMMPIIRACPKCLELIEHKEHCKHMVCPNSECKIEFCFFCLGVKTNGWPCGSYGDACPIAPRQKLQ